MPTAWHHRTSGPMPGSSRPALPPADLRHVLEHTRAIWDDLRGARVLVTGGTGFIGRWMVESLLAANEAHALGVQCFVLTRDASALDRAAPHVPRHPSVRVIQGD